MSDTNNTGLIPISEANLDAARGFMAAAMVQIGRGFAEQREPDQVVDPLVQSLAAILGARQISTQIMMDTVENVMTRALVGSDEGRAVMFKPGDDLSHADMAHLLTIRDDKQAVELFFRARPKLMKKITDAQIPLDRVVETLIQSSKYI